MAGYEYGRNPGRHTITWRLVVNSYPCPSCGAPPGKACVTGNDRTKYEPHNARSQRAAVRGWAFADAPARCIRCHGRLQPGTEAPARCIRCALREDGPAPTHATKDKPGPDGSYDVPLFDGEADE